MSAYSKRTRLILEFKRFQRLPDWAIIKLSEQRKSSDNSEKRTASWPLSPRAAVMKAEI